MRVKICGITNREDALHAVEAGADALGFILFPGSKRFITPEKAWAIAADLPPFVQRVGVVVDAGDAELELWRKASPFDLWQLHGQESPEFCRGLKGRGFRVVKALGFPLREKILPESYPVAAFLLDKASPRHGGTGESFDWTLGSAFARAAGKPCILSGGLTPENVVQAIQTMQPYAVDVCSGVEAQPGRKDRRKVEEFISLCRTQPPFPL